MIQILLERICLWYRHYVFNIWYIDQIQFVLMLDKIIRETIAIKYL